MSLSSIHFLFKQKNSEDIANVFARLMLQGKANAALKFLTDKSDQGLLPVNDDILRELRLKHPQPAPIQPNILLNGPLEQVPTNYFDSIDEVTIHRAAKLRNGAAGP